MRVAAILVLLPRVKNGQANYSAKLFIATTAFDMPVFITSLAVGILGATSTIHLSLPLSYSLVGVSGLVVLSYGILISNGVQVASISNERNRDGSRKFISGDITGHFQVVLKALKTVCSSSDV